MTLPARPEERQQEQEAEGKRGQADDHERLEPIRDDRQEREVADEIPVRPRVSDDDRRVRWLPEHRRAGDDREHDDDHHRDERHDRVPDRGIGIERDPAREQRPVLREIGAPVGALAGDRRLADPPLHDEVQVDREQAEDRRGDEEDVRGVEAGERRAADVRAGDDE